MPSSVVLHPESGSLIFSHPVSQRAISGFLGAGLTPNQSNMSLNGSLGLRSARLHRWGSAVWTLLSLFLSRPLNNACGLSSIYTDVETMTDQPGLGWRKNQLLDGLFVLTEHGKHP